MELLKIQENYYKEPTTQQRVLANRVPPKMIRKELKTVPAVEV